MKDKIPIVLFSLGGAIIGWLIAHSEYPWVWIAAVSCFLAGLLVMMWGRS